MPSSVLRSRPAWCVGLGLVALTAVPPEGASQQPRGSVSPETPPGEIRGAVVERGSERPISGAAVLLVRPTAEPSDGPAARRTLTDEHGAYRFGDVPPGEYRLEVTRLGYRSMTLWLELPPSWRLSRSVGLELDPVALEPLRSRVRGPRFAWPRRPSSPSRAPSISAPLRDRPTLDARALTPGEVRGMATLGEPDLFRALQRLPGVSSRGDFSAAPWTRGAPWGFTQVMLDGLPLYDPLHLGGAGTGLAVDGLEAAFLLPGARPASLSEGVAGTIQLVSRTARAEAGRSVAVSSVALRAHTEDRWLDDRVGLALTGRRSWWDLLGPEFLYGGSAGPYDYHFADLAGRLDARIGRTGVVELGGFWEEDRIDGDVGDLVARSRGRWGNRLGWVAFERSFGGVGLRATVGRSAFSLRAGPQPWASFRGRDGVPSLDHIELDLSRDVLRLEAGGAVAGGAVSWSAGMERLEERLEQFGSEAWDREAPGVDGAVVTAWGRGWGEGTLRLGSLRLAAGAAVDLADDLPLAGSPLRPSVRVRWNATRALTLEAARSRNRQLSYPLAPAGRGFGPGLGVGHVWILAGEERPALTSDVTTLALELHPADGLSGQVMAWERGSTGFWTRGVSTIVDGELVFLPRDGPPGSERARGVELLVRRDGGRVDGEVSYTLSRAEMEGAPGLVWASPADRRHSLDAILGAALSDGLRASGFLRAESGWPHLVGPWGCPRDERVCTPEEKELPRPDSFAFERSPAYVSLDLLLDWTRRGKRLTWGIAASVRNVLGQHNAAAYRPESCFGSELVSVVCERSLGQGEFSPGLTGFTPALAVRVEF